MSDSMVGVMRGLMLLAAAPAREVSAPGPAQLEWLHLEMTTAYVGVPFNILVAAAFGSLVGVWNQNLGTRRELGIAFLSSTLLAVTVSVLGPELFNLLAGRVLGPGYAPVGWSSTGVHASAAMLMGFTAQNWGPELIRSVGPLVRALLRRYLPRKEGSP